MPPLQCTHSSLSARLFVQLARRRYSTATAAAPCLEFLAPRSIMPSPLRTGRRNVIPNKVTMTMTMTMPSRSITSSASRRATLCVRNPVQDEDGNVKKLEITPRAAKRLSEIMAKDQNPNLALRIQVESGGCHGFQYLMSLTTIPPQDAAAESAADDTIFQYVGTEHDGVRAHIILDKPSLNLLNGSKVDFTMELIGSQFKIVDNPLATSSCGCGTSFDIKM